MSGQVASQRRGRDLFIGIRFLMTHAPAERPAAPLGLKIDVLMGFFKHAPIAI